MRTNRLRLLLIPLSLMGDKRIRAASDLDRYAGQLSDIVQKLPARYHRFALQLLHESQIYCFEQNKTRWPDGRFYMLDRGYEHWRGYKISFTAAELDALGLDEWRRKSTRIAFGKDIYPMEADDFLRPRARLRLPHYAEVVDRIAERMHEQAKHIIATERAA